MSGNTAPVPAVGETVVHDQPLGPLPGDPGQGAVGRLYHNVIIIDTETRQCRGTSGIRSGNPVPDRAFHPLHPWQSMVYWGQDNIDTIGRYGEYLPYQPLDGIAVPSSPLPVNPIPLGRKWRDILSRFAHDVMAFNPASNHLRDGDTYATGHLPPTDAASALKNKATYQLARAVVGVADHRIEQWMGLDAQRLAQYPASVPDADNWRIWQEGVIPVSESAIPHPNMNDMMSMLCGDEVTEVVGLCIGAWVYRLNDRIDASSFDSNMNSGGEIRLPDPAFHPWRPSRYLHRVTGSRSQKADQWAEIMGWFTAAHDHYLTSVAPPIEHAGRT